MPIENISRIYEKSVESSYLFDVPELEDSEAISSFIVRTKKHDISLSKITDLKEFVLEIKTLRVKSVPTNSRDYNRFLTLIRNYLEQYQYERLMEEEITDNVNDNDIKAIAIQYRDTLKKGKGLK